MVSDANVVATGDREKDTGVRCVTIVLFYSTALSVYVCRVQVRVCSAPTKTREASEWLAKEKSTETIKVSFAAARRP